MNIKLDLDFATQCFVNLAQNKGMDTKTFQAGLDSAGAATIGEFAKKLTSTYSHKYGEVANHVVPPSILIYKNLSNSSEKEDR